MDRPPPVNLTRRRGDRGDPAGFCGIRSSAPWRLGARSLRVLAACSLALAGAPTAPAHEGPEHEIEELTALLAQRGESPELLVERAVEYGILGRHPEAKRDLERAIQLDPASLPALRELARLQFRLGQADEALPTVTRALALPIAERVDRGSLLVLRAEIRRSQGLLRPALEDCDAALRLHGENPEWYLLRSDLQRRLKLHRRRLAELAEGIRRTGAGVLEIERVEALLDAGRYRAALERIEPELASSRVRCRWLVRRGRARIGLGRRTEGEADLRGALMEIANLLDPVRPDASLLLDQARALLLLGDREGARGALESARARGDDPSVVERIEALLGEPSAGQAKDPDPPPRGSAAAGRS
jgi:tetratricopeptide (TPR) repeat protein